MKVKFNPIRKIVGECNQESLEADYITIATHDDENVDIVHLAIDATQNGSYIQADLTSEEAVQLANVLNRLAMEKRAEMAEYYKEVED